MSFNRFCFVHANICFDNPDTKKELLQHDRFIPIRDTFEKCYKQCSLIINPGLFVIGRDTCTHAEQKLLLSSTILTSHRNMVYI